MQNNEDTIEIDIFEMFMFMLRRWYTFVLASLLTTVVGMAICLFFITPQYESTTKIIILSQQNSGSLTYSDLQLASQLTKDYEELIVSRDVLEAVIWNCSLEDDYDELLNRVDVENVSDTRIISITVKDPSPETAQAIANNIRETAADHIKNVMDVEAVNMVEAANLPDEPASPSKLKWAAVSAAIGFLIVLIVQAVRFMSDDTIKSAEDVEKYLGLSTLALIPKTDMGVQPRQPQKQASRPAARQASSGDSGGGGRPARPSDAGGGGGRARPSGTHDTGSRHSAPTQRR